MSTLRYIFYGGVEGAYQNQDLSDLSFLDPIYGANVGGYQEGQLITGSLSLSGDALAIANSYSYSVSARVDVQHFGVVLNESTDFAYEAIDDLVHAADWLKECRLPLVFKRLVEAMLPELCAEKFF